MDGDISDADGTQCIICLSGWSNAGPHQICCLKCGHVFGKSCVEMWLKNKSKCPQCQQPAKKSDIRPLFVSKSLAAYDSAELDRLKKELQSERNAHAITRAERSKFQSEYEELRQQVVQLKRLVRNNASLSTDNECSDL